MQGGVGQQMYVNVKPGSYRIKYEYYMTLNTASILITHSLLRIQLFLAFNNSREPWK